MKERTSVTQVALWGLSNWLVIYLFNFIILLFIFLGGFLVHRYGTDTYTGFFFLPNFVIKILLANISQKLAC